MPDESLRAEFLSGADALLPPPRPLSPRRAMQQAWGGLTSREREVAWLIADGKSNRAIAETLCLSERTVAVHVSSILTKLDLTSRAQIAAWVVEKGLPGPS